MVNNLGKSTKIVMAVGFVIRDNPCLSVVEGIFP